MKNIKFTCRANPAAAAKRIAGIIAASLNEGRTQHYTPEWTTPIEVTEGAEKCGYGALHIAGECEQWGGTQFARYSIESAGSQWRNYGAPHGTKYDVTVRLVGAAVAA